MIREAISSGTKRFVARRRRRAAVFHRPLARRIKPRHGHGRPTPELRFVSGR